MTSSVRTITRVGKIRYVNSLPFYHQLAFPDAPQIAFHESYPTRLNLLMRQSKIDIAPVSSLEYLNHQKDYFLLPEVVIGSRDFSGSVLLVSREKIEGLNGKEITLTRQSLSSAALLRVLLKFKYKFQNRFLVSKEKPEKMLEKSGAVLIIGDDALFYHPRDFVYKYDLSELWWNWTEKPFCFALWAVRREFALAHPEEVRAFYARLKENVSRNLTDIESLIKESLDMTFMDARFPKIFGYLFNLSYGLDQAMQEGLELFYRLAHRLGISPRPEKLQFFKVN